MLAHTNRALIKKPITYGAVLIVKVTPPTRPRTLRMCLQWGRDTMWGAEALTRKLGITLPHESMTLHDIAKLNGTFTEGGLIAQGFSSAVIRDAISVGLLRPNRMGVLETIKPEFRAGKLGSVSEEQGGGGIPQTSRERAVQHQAKKTINKNKCQGHPAGPYDPMGQTVYCDGSCRIGVHTESFQVGQKVVHNVNGVAVPFQVKAINGDVAILVSTDGKNTQSQASVRELALAPMTDDEKRAAAQQQQKINAAPSAPKPNSGGMSSTNPGSSAIESESFAAPVVQAGHDVTTAQGRHDFTYKIMRLIPDAKAKGMDFNQFVEMIAQQLDVRYQNLPGDLQREISTDWQRTAGGMSSTSSGAMGESSARDPRTILKEIGLNPTFETCQHCGRSITQDNNGVWVDPEATGDDSIWRETCQSHDTFTAEHEPVSAEDATWKVRNVRPPIHP
jgi:hypothetical protein